VNSVEVLIAKYWPLVMGSLAVLGTFIYNSKKVQIDESALVLEKWKQFAEMHAADMTRLRSEMDKDRTRLEAELELVREELKEVRAEFKIFRRDAEDQIKTRDVEIAGLKRTISQISQSTAVQLGRVKGSVSKMQGDKDEAHEEINQHLAKLDGQVGHNSLNEEDGA
jgi:SMC interacting uncharacterized protein involved in chromosome segregation